MHNNNFVVVGDSGTILTSSDSISWTTRSSGTISHLRGLNYALNNYIIIGNGGTILTSLDGISWNQRDPGITSSLRDLIFENEACHFESRNCFR